MLGSSGKERADESWINKAHAVFYKKLFPAISQNSNDKLKSFLNEVSINKFAMM